VQGWITFMRTYFWLTEPSKRFEKPILVLVAITLTAISLASTPAVDKIQLENSGQYPLFYASTLPFVYFVAIAYLALLAVFSRDRYVKLLSVMLVAVLVLFTPSIMLANPLVPDQYPYLAEAMWLVKNHHIVQFHYLGQTPGLGLMFSQFMLVTGLGPFEVSKLYSILIVLVTPLIFLTGERICGDGAFPSLLFFGFSFHQPNVYHRNTFFLILFIPMLFLLIKGMHERKLGFSLGYILIASAMVLSYPGSIVPIVSLMIVAILFTLLNDGERGIIKLITPLLFAIIFLSWNAFAATWEFGRMVGDIYGGLQELIYPTTERLLEITAYGGASLSEIFHLLNTGRIALTILLVSLALPLSVYIVFRRREHRIEAVFLSGIFLATSVQLSLLSLFTYYGLPTAFKLHTFFVYLSVPCIPLLLKLKFVKHKDKVKLVLGVSALALLLLVPLLSYSTIPFLHVPSSELSAKFFIDTHYSGKESILATESNLPYGLSILLKGEMVLEPKAILTPKEPIHYDSNYLILQRFMTRDGFFVYPTGFKDYLETLISLLTISHNVVYDSGNYTRLFIKT